MLDQDEISDGGERLHARHPGDVGREGIPIGANFADLAKERLPVIKGRNRRFGRGQRDVVKRRYDMADCADKVLRNQTVSDAHPGQSGPFAHRAQDHHIREPIHEREMSERPANSA